MQFGVLGSLEVVADDGHPLDIGGSQPRHLLAMLLVASGRIVPVDALIEGVWGERPPGSAAGTLQSYVSRLRRTIEPERGAGQDAKVLVWEPPGYRLNVDADVVDFRRFERLADEGRELLDAGAADEARARLAEALTLWRGPALLEFADQEFARGVAVRLEDRRLATVEDRIAADLALGRHTAVIGELTELVAAHPLREGLWGHLALALYRSGRQAEALRAIDEMRRTLRDELGVDPSRQIRELESSILAHDPALDRPERPIPVARIPQRAERAPAEHVVGAGERLVGRQAEVAQLRALLGDVLAGRSRMALIEGEPGIGKTRLLEQVGDDAVANGAEVLWGRSFEAGASPAFWPWLNLLRTLLERDDTPSADRAAIEVLSRILATSGGPSDAPALDANWFQLVEGIARLLERAAASVPLVFLLDDLQWADRASLELLEFLVGRVVGSRVMYAATLRTMELTTDDRLVRSLATLSSRPGTRRLELGGVSQADTAELVELAVGHEVAPEMARAIHARAEGNPFFASELARLMVSDDEATVDPSAVPASVRDVIRRRLGLVPAETRDLLQVAAVIGRSVDFDLLPKAADLDVATCVDRIEPAVESRLLTTVPGRPSMFRFSHALIREVVLDEVSQLRRARLHLRVADAMEAAGGVCDDDVEILAEHLWWALPLGASTRAAVALERAADVAVRRYAFAAAEQLLERALELRGVMVPADDEAELLAMHRIAAIRRMRRGYVLTHQAEFTSRAEVLAERTGRRDLLVDLLWAEWAAATTACDHASADRLATQLLDLGRRSPEPEFAAVGEGAWGVFCFHQGRVAEAREYLDRAVALGRGLEPGDGLWEHLVISSSFHLLAHEISDEVGDGDVWLAELVERHREPYQRLILGMFGALGATIAGDAARAERAARAGLAATPEQSFPFFTAATEILLGSSLVEQGAVDEGIGLMTQGGLRYRNPNVRVIVPFYVALRARANARAGNHERALATIDDAARRLAESGERWPAPFLLIDEAEVRHLAGADTARVVELLREARSLATAQGARAPARQAEERAVRLGVALD